MITNEDRIARTLKYGSLEQVFQKWTQSPDLRDGYYIRTLSSTGSLRLTAAFELYLKEREYTIEEFREYI